MHSPMSTFLHAQQCFVRHLCQCMRQGSALPCILRCLFMHMRQCMRGASVGKPVQSAVFCFPHACGSLPFFCSHILRLSIVSGLFSPYPSLFFHSIYYISVSGALLTFCVGAHGWVARICQPWEQSHLGASCLLWKLLVVWGTQPPFSDAVVK